jgi:ribonuclease R
MRDRKKQYSDFDRSIIDLFLKGRNTNLTVKEVSKRIGIKDKKDYPMVEAHLNNLIRDKALIMINSKKYQIDPTFMKEEVGYLHYLIGIVDMKQTGKAYVVPDDGSEDVFIAINNTFHALSGDKVKVYLFPQRKKRKREGQIVEIIERKKDSFVGIIQRHENYSFLIADDNSMPVDIFLPKGCEMDAKDGEKALAKITEWPERANNPFGKVIKVLGEPGDNDVEMQSILSDFNFPLSFPPEVEQEAEKIQETIPESEIKKRKDFRSTMTFTIDPIDAKDFDDAISIKQLNNEEFEVGVHIADVSYYVKPQSFLNREAYKRATSVYLVDRTIPMLPEKLCNEVCSLRQDEDSLTFSVVFVINKNTLEISKHWIGRTVIHSNRRFNYDEVQKVIEDNQGEKSEYILPLWDIAKGLREKRFSKGAINFETPEVKFRLDENKKPIGIYIKETKEANWLVEEFMLLANKTVAEEIGKVKNKNQAKTFVYRVHDEPNQEKVATFKTFVAKLGYKIEDKSRKSLVNSYNILFNKVKGKGEETLISTIALKDNE